MRRILAPLVALTTACASAPHVYADEGQPEGIPKSARAHCRSWAPEVAKEVAKLPDAARLCLDALLRADCADDLAATASRLEEAGKGEDAFFFRFPGAWEPADVHQQVMEQANAACLKNGLAMLQAVKALDDLRRAHGGRIPWATFGAPKPGAGMCREGCPTR